MAVEIGDDLLKVLQRIEDATLGTLAGDVTGLANANTVGKIQGKAVSATAPTANYGLIWSGTAWVPVLVLHVVAAPTDSGDPGEPGDVAYDVGFFYVCVAHNVWRRCSILAFAAP